MTSSASLPPSAFDRAFAAHRAGRADEAFRGYEAVLRTNARHAPALHLSALLLHGAGRTDDALARIERSLAIDARVPDAWVNAALLYTAVGRTDDAARSLEAALRLEPTLEHAWRNLASLRLAVDDAVGAEAAARRALALAASPPARFQLALALAAQRRSAEALDALDAGPDHDDVGVPALRAQLLVALGLPDAAGRVLDQAIARRDAPGLRIERARLHDAAGRADGALADYDAALRLDPDDETALSDAVFLRKRLVAWDGLAPLQRRFRARVAHHAARGDASALTPFSLLSDLSTRAEQRAAAAAWSRRYRVHPRTRRPIWSGRVKVGYLSADFHAHATGLLAAGLFERHDRARFEVVGYSTGPDDGSALRARLVAAFDRFVDVRGWSDDRIAAAIRNDGIDVLVDLKGHTERATTGVMARAPAPIAVAYLGYPGTMGASFVDYLIGDAVVTPLDEAGDYDETLVLLPDSYQVTDDRRTIGDAPSRRDLGLPDDGLVFCCFNQTYKITPEVFDAWAAILRDVPGSVLWLLTRPGDDAVRHRLRGEAAARGLAPDRVVFTDTRGHADYLALYRRADLFVDTWPYNAHTTASDALWAGCPLLTLQGSTFAGRVAESVLRAGGFADGIARDRDDYVARAVDWGCRPAVLRALGRGLAARVRASPLFDTAGTVRAIEAAYDAMVGQYRTGTRAPIVVADRARDDAPRQADGAAGASGTA